MILRIYRQSSRGPLFYCMSTETNRTVLKSAIFTSILRSVKKNLGAIDSFEIFLAQMSGFTNTLKIIHPPDITPDDILVTASDALYEYRSKSFGSGSIAIACAYASWAMPCGGFTVVLFKHAVLPLFSVYGACRFFQAHILAQGSERLTNLIRSGSYDFEPM